MPSFYGKSFLFGTWRPRHLKAASSRQPMDALADLDMTKSGLGQGSRVADSAKAAKSYLTSFEV